MNMRMVGAGRFGALGLLLCGCMAGGAPLVIADLDGHAPVWRSKFSKHETATVERGGRSTRVLRLPHDLSKAPHYNWVRAMVPDGVDTRPFAFLSFRVRNDGGPVRLISMLMQTAKAGAGRPHGEIVANASRRTVDLTFDGWRQLSIPLMAYGKLPDIAAAIDQVNFSLTRIPGREAAPGVLFLDDIRLVAKAEGCRVSRRAFPILRRTSRWSTSVRSSRCWTWSGRS